jgi:DNA-binding MarR family transcriptional regulator
MVTSIHEELRSTLEEDPGSLRSAQLMEELFWRIIEQIEIPKRNALAQFANATATLARQFLSRAPREPGTWQLWYAGQMHGVAGLVNLMLSRQLALETAAALRSRKHFIPILSKLAENDLRVSDLARAMILDESQIGREIKLLNGHNLVETVKEGRERWIRITPTGRTALSEVLETNPAIPESPDGSNSEISRLISNGVRADDSRVVNKIFSSVNMFALEEQSKRLPVNMLAEART